MKKSDIKMRYCSLFLLIEFLLFLFQSLNGIVSIWGIVPTIINVVIFINIIRQTSGKPKVEHSKLKIVKKINERKKNNSETSIEDSEKNLYYKELNEKKSSGKGQLAGKIIMLILFLGLGGLFVYLNSTQSLGYNEKIVKANIYTQQSYYDYYEESNINLLTVSYNSDGVKYTKDIVLKTNVIHAKSINLVIDEENEVVTKGGYAKTSDYLSLFVILAVIMFICAGIMILSFIFKSQTGATVLFSIFFALGICLSFALNMNLFANMLFNPLTVFCWCFMSIGLYGLACSFFAKDEM